MLSARSWLFAALATIGLCTSVNAQRVEESRWSAAEADIVRLHPNDFTEAPPAVRESLEEMGCQIPQAWGEPDAHNLIAGSRRPGRRIGLLSARATGSPSSSSSGEVRPVVRRDWRPRPIALIYKRSVPRAFCIRGWSTPFLSSRWTGTGHIRRRRRGPRSPMMYCPMRFSRRARRPITAMKVIG